MNLLEKPYWIFDLDGTLTVAMHDFEAFRSSAGLPSGVPILEALDAVSGPEAAALHVKLADWERDVARLSLLQPGALALVSALAAREHSLGILTRNLREIAFETLDAVGLRSFFRDQTVIGRDEAPPKPDPGGVDKLLRAWGARSAEAVLVGDFRFDLQAGRAAGTTTVYIDPSGDFPDAEHADHCIRALAELL
ncbi:MAG: HAD-IA family hydrolase [Planctomycetota bacterium]